MLLNALWASTKITASVEESSKMSRTEWIADSALDFQPVAVCNDPADSCMSSFNIQFIAFPIIPLKAYSFPIIPLKASPTPMGLKLGIFIQQY